MSFRLDIFHVNCFVELIHTYGIPSGALRIVFDLSLVIQTLVVGVTVLIPFLVSLMLREATNALKSTSALSTFKIGLRDWS